MPISQLSQQSQEFAVNSLYRELYGMKRPPNDLVGDDGQEITLETRLNELFTLFEQDQGQVDIGRFILANPRAGERDLSNAERTASLIEPFSDFQDEIESLEIAKIKDYEHVSLFHAFMARNNLPFKDDNKISEEELEMAKEFVTELETQLQENPNTSIAKIRDEFGDVVAKKEAEIETELARRAEAEAAEAKRLADAELEAFALNNKELIARVTEQTEEISHKFSISVFAKDPEGYDGLFELNAGDVSFENGTMNNTTQEYLHGMLRQNETELMAIYKGTGEPPIENKWDLRDKMYSKETPYDYENDVPNAKLSDFGKEVVARLTTDMGLDAKVNDKMEEHITAVVKQHAEAQTQQIEEAKIEHTQEMDQEVESTIISTHASPHSTGDFEEALQTQARIREFNEAGDFEAALKLSTSFAEENMARISNEQVQFVEQNMDVFNDFPSLEGLNSTLIVARFNDPDQRNALDLEIRQEGHMDSWETAFTQAFKSLTNQYREFSTMRSTEAPRNEDGSMPDNLKPDGKGTEVPKGEGLEVLKTGPGQDSIFGAIYDRVSSWLHDETKPIPNLDGNDNVDDVNEANREAAYNQWMP